MIKRRETYLITTYLITKSSFFILFFLKEEEIKMMIFDDFSLVRSTSYINVLYNSFHLFIDNDQKVFHKLFDYRPLLSWL